MRRLIIFALLLASCSHSVEYRSDVTLEEGWKFTREDGNFTLLSLDDSQWQDVTVPHDWAIYGPFDANNDAQTVAITQNFETEATLKTGRTGGLPYIGVGWYRKRFDADATKKVELLFDGAMSGAQVYVNEHFVGEWPYGYNAFHFDISPYLNKDGKDNLLAVRLENLPESSRWYPGAGLYRNVHIITTNKTSVPIWGTTVVTPEVSESSAVVYLSVKVDGLDTSDLSINTKIIDSKGKTVASSDEHIYTSSGSYDQQFLVHEPNLWSPEHPNLYKAVTSLYIKGEKLDEYTTRFGIRSIELVPEKGFFLNGVQRKFQGVCNHHDLGPLGAAVNVAALRHQLTMLKEMGCDAIRTSHNMPAPELVELCDEMGFLMMIEPFDEWNLAKCQNGYHRLFDEWAEKDMINMIHHFRNNPSVVSWSIGNEVPGQCEPIGAETAKFLADIVRREDPTRFITCGMDQVACVLKNNFANTLDVPGLNYRTFLYEEAFETFPQRLVLGSETASTISSRGVYKFPVVQTARVQHPDRQCSSYDVETCWWSNIPDIDFALMDDYEWTIGQFVWTGFDYLGEPTPYETMPNHSSNFGIIDLASIPKDRYYLYRSIWRTDEETLHILPHWTWPERVGEVTPVFVYTNYPSAELFVNGISQGVRTKDKDGELTRYRLIWDNVVYQPGEIKVIAYNSEGKLAAEKILRTAGEPAKIVLTPNRKQIAADGKDLVYIEISVVDKDGNLCPADSRLVNFELTGKGTYRCSANGDPTCLDLFHLPQMHLFNGKLTAIVQSTTESGSFYFTASAPGLESGSIKIKTK